MVAAGLSWYWLPRVGVVAARWCEVRAAPASRRDVSAGRRQASVAVSYGGVHPVAGAWVGSGPSPAQIHEPRAQIRVGVLGSVPRLAAWLAAVLGACHVLAGGGAQELGVVRWCGWLLPVESEQGMMAGLRSSWLASFAM